MHVSVVYSYILYNTTLSSRTSGAHGAALWEVTPCYLVEVCRYIRRSSGYGTVRKEEAW